MLNCKYILNFLTAPTLLLMYPALCSWWTAVANECEKSPLRGTPLLGGGWGNIFNSFSKACLTNGNNINCASRGSTNSSNSVNSKEHGTKKGSSRHHTDTFNLTDSLTHTHTLADICMSSRQALSRPPLGPPALKTTMNKF